MSRVSHQFLITAKNVAFLCVLNICQHICGVVLVSIKVVRHTGLSLVSYVATISCIERAIDGKGGPQEVIHFILV